MAALNGRAGESGLHRMFKDYVRKGQVGPLCTIPRNKWSQMDSEISASVWDAMGYNSAIDRAMSDNWRGIKMMMSPFRIVLDISVHRRFMVSPLNAEVRA